MRSESQSLNYYVTLQSQKIKVTKVWFGVIRSECFSLSLCFRFRKGFFRMTYLNPTYANNWCRFSPKLAMIDRAVQT